MFFKIAIWKNVASRSYLATTEINIRYEFDLKVILKNSCSRLWLNFQATVKFVIISVRWILPKVEVDGFTGSQRESDIS